MKIVYSWLKEIVDIDVPAEELADALTAVGLEVASIQHIRIPEKIKVARVLEVGKHPNADRLSVCKVDAGGETPLTVVCGAPNVSAGMIAPLAVEGAMLGPDMTVKKTKIRGVESFGMMCSERELGLSDNHAGLLSLPEHYKIGDDLSVYFPEDAVIEIELTPSRGDCLSVMGVAREVAARYGLPLKEVAQRPAETAKDPVDKAISVAIEAPDGCPRYAGRLIRGISIVPSPEWMQRRLSLAGLRPINNIVDVTNYLMLHYGQPMHAFDYSLIHGRQIVVKRSGGAQKFSTLDNTERTLTADDLLICDGDRPVALAGIMGGAGSEISATTADVFLECAFFEQGGIRKTSKRLGLSTDSSYRFERGVDPDSGLIDALDTAAALIAELGNGKVAKGRIDVYPKKLERRTITIRPSRAAKILGREFSAEQVTGFLSSLGLVCKQEGADRILCTVPLYRHDLTEEVDLIEEVGRLYGYDSITPSEYSPTQLFRRPPATEMTADAIRNALAYFGLNEIVTNSMTSEKRRALLTPDTTPVVLLNPLSPDMAQMRTTLAGNMLEVASYNLNRKNLNNKLFEVGKTYALLPAGKPHEVDVLGILVEGNWRDASWNGPSVPCDHFVLKGIVEAFAARIGLASQVTIAPAASPSPIFDQDWAIVTIGNLMKGSMGKIAKTIRDHFAIKTDVYYVEIEITDFLNAPRSEVKYRYLPKFPAIERDFNFVMPESLSAAAIVEEFYKISPLIHDVTPFDIYWGEQLGKGFKSITFSIKIRSDEKTLADSDAEKIGVAIVKAMSDKFGVKLRG
jgi:phenylalanyl-tRNA synthetase beta chain